VVARNEVETVIHIHNGDVVADRARRSDVPGEHVAFRESLVTGRVSPEGDWLETRARTLAEGYGLGLLRVRTDLLEQELMLDRARTEQEVVLWFEHDLYCLVHLVYLLQRLAGTRITLVWSPEPLGTLDERDLHLLFESRAAVTPAMGRLASETWRDYISPDPTGLNRWQSAATGDFPFLREGLRLHASRFPSTRNGLGSVEERALSRLAAGFTDFAALFDRMVTEEPRLGFTDSEIFRTLCGMAWVAAPLLTISGELPKAICTITPLGEKVLAGELDALSVNAPDGWLGGVHLTGENVWRWDGEKIVSSRSAGS
jgi:hypothetical protein